MFDARLLKLCPKATKLALASVAVRWLALLAQVAVLMFAAKLLGSACDGESVDFRVFDLQVAVGVIAYLLLLALAGWLQERSASSLQAQVCARVFGKAASLGVARESVIDDARAASLVGDGAQKLKLYLSRYFTQFLYALAALLTLFAVIARLCLPAAAAMLVCVLLMPLSIVMLMRRAKGFMGEHWNRHEDLGAAFLDAVRGLVTLRVFGSDACEHEALDKQAADVAASTMRLLKVQLGNVVLMDLFSYGGMAMGVCIAAGMAASGGLNVTSALVVAFLTRGFFTPMRSFGAQFHTGMNAAPVIDALFELLDAPDPALGTVEMRAGQVSLELDDVGFAYQPQSGRYALHGVDLHVWPNSFIGLAGVSGSGKSTLVKVLGGDLRNYTGSITCNGIELSSIEPQSLSRLVTVVSRQSHVFKGSFRTNLAIAAPQAGDPALWEALRQAHLDEYVLSCGGLDALVDADGASLSGGQRQRLCFARALLRNTPVYVFDEATSNVDAQSEQMLMEAIQKLALSKTVIVATHRLSQLRYADEILLLQDGCVLERGNHSELIACDGVYKQMWDSNAQLERFAQEVADELPQEEPSPLAAALAKMPGMMQGIMGAFVSIMRTERINSAGGSGPAGHPAWIPLPDYQAGMSRQGQTGDEGDEGAAGDALAASAADDVADDAAAPAGMEGFVEATLGDVAADEAQEIRQAMRVVRDCMAQPTQMQVRVTPPPPVKRPILKIVQSLMALTSSMLKELVLAGVLGALSHVAAIASAVLAAAALLAAVNLAQMPFAACIAGSLLCAVACGPLHYAQRLLTHDQTFKTLAAVRSAVFGKLRRVSLGAIGSRDAGEGLNLLTSAVDKLEGFYSRVTSPLLAATLLAVFMLVAFAFANPLLAAVAFASYALVAVLLPAVSARLTRERGAELNAYATLMTGFFIDSLRGMGDLVRFGRARDYQDELLEHMESLGAGQSSFAKLTAVLAALPQVASLACGVVFAGMSCALAATGVMDVSLAAMCAIAFMASMSPMVDIASLGFSLHQTLAAADQVLDVLELDEVRDMPDAFDVGSFERLEVSNLGFSYDGVQVLDDISFGFEAGQFVGIAGKSGAGKSTLLQLMMRFDDPCKGSVNVNGIDLRCLKVAALRSLMAYMPQETYLFDGSLRRNLLVAKPTAGDKELKAAIEAASLDELAARLPQGLDTRVCGEGSSLSDGERQRVGLARAFLCGAPLLLLDEPTSNLDALNEAAILRALCTGAEGKTVVIVSHRKAVAAIVDKLLVVEDERES